jgi:hypothetical protein
LAYARIEGGACDHAYEKAFEDVKFHVTSNSA